MPAKCWHKKAPEKPIWDSRVKSILEFNIQGNSRKKKKKSIINIYYRIEETYKSYLGSCRLPA